jgi:hypothetical protein
MYQAITYATPAHVQRQGLVRLEGWQDNHAIYLHTLATP